MMIIDVERRNLNVRTFDSASTKARPSLHSFRVTDFCPSYLPQTPVPPGHSFDRFQTISHASVS